MLAEVFVKMKAEHLVIDSCAFIKLTDISSIAEHVYTCPDVVKEVRDRAVRRMLSVLPYELILISPAPESVQKIIDASKTTGDYRSLSHTDIQVLALTYELSMKHGESPNDELIKNTDVIQMGGSIKADLSIPGFYLPSNKHEDNEAESNDTSTDANISETMNALQLEDDDSSSGKDNDGGGSFGGWITPAKLRELNRNQECGPPVKVACITRDFAMQNVLKKMEMNIVSVDGKLIRSVRSYVLRCHACYEVTKITTKVFCPKCGNKTLKRVPVELAEDGTMKMFFSRNPKVLSRKGLKPSIPLPRGGKHANNPILVEDQRVPQNRLPRKALAKTDVWAENYECEVSPFAPTDVDSRAFRLGIRASSNRKSGSGTRFLKRR